MNAAFLPVGDTAVSVQVGDEISLAVSRRVYALKQCLEDNPVEGIAETVPTYRALMINYRPDVIRYGALLEACKKRFENLDLDYSFSLSKEEICEIPVLYGGEFGVDLDEVAVYHKKTPQEIIDIHTAHDNFNYMMGFTPGMGYLGSDNGLTIPRRQSPRLKVEGGAVIIWANQSIVFPITAPTGWNVIGKTPVRIFDMREENPFLFKAGMWVRFRSVDQAGFDKIAEQVEAGVYRCRFENREVRP
ncbi:MAG: 5-oxoprolinase subunit PxpB [Synergistaceae bacterium]|jgi:KipI family sensor histidine kinase inhibitor|nr:5-oxoprolinase subunit PxpB [Synergistaceae bacterium]